MEIAVKILCSKCGEVWWQSYKEAVVCPACREKLPGARVLELISNEEEDK